MDLGVLDTAMRDGCSTSWITRISSGDVPALAGVITTGENLARRSAGCSTARCPRAASSRVAVVETENNRFEYEASRRVSAMNES